MFEARNKGGLIMAEEESDLREEAKKRLNKKRDLGAHLVAYVVINAMLVSIWAMTGAGYFWPAWVLFGWGVGVVLNVWDVYFRRPVTEHDIQREIERLRR
jgi:hypothetical protein